MAIKNTGWCSNAGEARVAANAASDQATIHTRCPRDVLAVDHHLCRHVAGRGANASESACSGWVRVAAGLAKGSPAVAIGFAREIAIPAKIDAAERRLRIHPIWGAYDPAMPVQYAARLIHGMTEYPEYGMLLSPSCLLMVESGRSRAR